MISNQPKTGHNFLPLPALSSSSHCRLCTNLTFGVLSELRHSSVLVSRFICAGVSGISDYQAFWLILYFVLNLVLTLYNKVLLVSFPYPYTLTAIHALFGLAGGTYLRLIKFYEPRSLCGSDHVVVVTFSILYSVNIAISNASLGLVTVPVSQLPALKQHAVNITLQSSIRLFVPQRLFLRQSSLGTFSIPVLTDIKYFR